MSLSPAIDARIWGSRGTFPMVGAEALHYGGHTACVEVRAGGGGVMIFDAGSDIIPLGKALLEEGVTEIDLFFQPRPLRPHHRPAVLPAGFLEQGEAAHLGGPACRTARRPSNWSTASSGRLASRISKDYMRAEVEYHKFSPGDVLEPSPGVRIVTGSLTHPNGAVGYRIERGGATFRYLTDFEHMTAAPATPKFSGWRTTPIWRCSMRRIRRRNIRAT